MGLNSIDVLQLPELLRKIQLSVNFDKVNATGFLFSIIAYSSGTEQCTGGLY